MTGNNRQRKKRSGLIIAFAAMTFVFMMPNMFAYAEGDNWAGLQEKINAGGTIKLEQDYTAGDSDTALIVPEGKTVTLDLNGHTIDRGLTKTEAKENGNVITVKGGLTLTDSSSGKSGNITGGKNNDSGGGVIIDAGAGFVMGNGKISNNRSTGDGGGIYLREGANEFIMNAGTISGNHADNIGGGICLGNTDEDKSSTITMTGGTISNNGSGVSGGGVAVREGSFTMSGGTISNNETAVEHGGGVFLIGDIAEFIMKDGATISGNKANGDGGGVRVLVGSIDMSGGLISDNTAGVDGGGVYIECGWNSSRSQSFDMSGGTITANRAGKGDGGGVYANVDMTMSGGTISNNTAGADGGGAYVGERCDFIMKGESAITGNSVNTFDGDGGGVCVIGSIEMSGGTISKNSAVDGGGVYLYSSAFRMTGGAINENVAIQDGGGINANRDSEFTLSGGSISVNETTDGDSGGVLFTGKSFTMSGGDISGNKCHGDGGGVGIYEGTYSLTGGNIVNNKLTDKNADDEHGGGIFFSDGTFNLSGNPVIKDNSGTKGQSENVYLIRGDQFINIANKLESSAKVGVTMRSDTGTFTTGYKTKMSDADPAAYFTSDDTTYKVLRDDNGEAKLGRSVVKKVDIQIASPACGDMISIRDRKYQIGAKPNVTIPEDAHYSVALLDDGETLSTYWGTIEDGSYQTFENGKVLKGGQTYKALVFIKADTGYQIASNVSVKVNGKDDPMYSFTDDNQLRVYWDLTATHKLSRTEARAATCTEEGNIEYWTCGECSKRFTDSEGKGEATDDAIVIPATGHKWGDTWTTVRPATEQEDGLEERECLNEGCQQKDSRAIPKFQHTHTLSLVNEEPAGCTRSGHQSYYGCSGCGAIFEDAEGKVQTSIESIRIPATGHKRGEAEKGEETPATCSSVGGYNLTTRCSNSGCGKVLTVEHVVTPVDPDAHHWGEWTVIKEATKDEEGLEEHVCMNDISHRETRVIPKKGADIPVGSVHNVSGSNYVVTSAGTVSLLKAKSKKSFTLPATVGIAGKTFSVTGINARAFAGTKVKTLTVKTKGLTKASVKGSLKGSKVRTVKVKVGKKKDNKKYVKKYKKYFTKKNCGKKVRVRR